MGEDVNFGRMSGYLAGDGPAGVIVLHEWDGLVPHIRDVADRVAYPGTQHAFFNDTYPDNYNEAAASLSWVRTISFLRKHLAT